MRWFRAEIRQGSSFALLALAINLALSFGHIHVNGADGNETTSSVLLSAIVHHDNGPSHQHSDRDGLCAICMAQAALGTGLAAGAPVLPADLATITLDPTSGPLYTIPRRPSAAFQSRGPPPC